MKNNRILQSAPVLTWMVLSHFLQCWKQNMIRRAQFGPNKLLLSRRTHIFTHNFFLSYTNWLWICIDMAQGLENATFTKGFILATVGSSIISQAFRASRRSGLAQGAPLSRLLVFQNPGELFVGAFLLWVLKYSSFWFIKWFQWVIFVTIYATATGSCHLCSLNFGMNLLILFGTNLFSPSPACQSYSSPSITGTISESWSASMVPPSLEPLLWLWQGSQL
jgi:hypothetical protein